MITQTVIKNDTVYSTAIITVKLGPDSILEQLERLRSEDTPRHLMITHTSESCWIPSQNKVEWPWRYRSRSKVITCNTPSHASNHLYQTWKESIQNYRRYRADTIFKVKAEWPWKYRSSSVHSRQGNVREKWIFSRSGNCQGILPSVREILTFGKIGEKRHGISYNVRENYHFIQHNFSVSTYIDQLAKSRFKSFLK